MIYIYSMPDITLIRKIDFPYDGYGLAAGAGGRVLFSTDGSATVRVWEPVFDANGYVKTLKKAGTAERKRRAEIADGSDATSSSSSGDYIPPSKFDGASLPRVNEMEIIGG